MPALREAMPGIKLHLYGSDMPATFEALAADDIVLEGFVENLSTLFETHRVFVAPLLSGAGLKGKVLEAMSFGVPAVVSPIAAEGTGLVDGVSARVATSPVEWVEAIHELYVDEGRWVALSQACLGVARTHFSFARGCQQMRGILRALDIHAPERSRALVTRRAL